MTSRFAVTEERIVGWHKEGRGTGEGSSYKPWIKVTDISSSGRSHRFFGATARRQHHLLSDLEHAFCLEADWHQDVLDIREQFPLPREETRALAADMQTRHPRDGKVDIVMTTDLLLNVRGPGDDRERLVALCVKPSEKLSDRRVLEKLEIERRYWVTRGATFRVVTELQRSRRRVMTLRRLAAARRLDILDEGEPHWLGICAMVFGALPHARAASLTAFCTELDGHNGWADGSALFAVGHLAAMRIVCIDIDRFDVQGPVSQLVVPATRSRPEPPA